MFQLLYLQGNSPWYPLDRRLGGSQSQSGHWSKGLIFKLLCNMNFISGCSLQETCRKGNSILKEAESARNRNVNTYWTSVWQIYYGQQFRRIKHHAKT